MKLHELKDVIFGEGNEAKSTLKDKLGGNEKLINKFITSGKRIKITARSKHKNNRRNKNND